ncbi:Ssy5p PWA37_005243 [Arxiozyma heterogenica]|uniref:Ssy5p n=1 Tax=Arxiozyma heterogenica TaxID=278026 RepID=UPI002EF44D05
MSGKLFNFNKKSFKSGSKNISSASDDNKGNKKENYNINDNKSIITKSIVSSNTLISDKSSSIFSRGKITYTSSKISSNVSGSIRQHEKQSISSVGGNTYNNLGKPLRVLNNSNKFSLGAVKEEGQIIDSKDPEVISQHVVDIVSSSNNCEKSNNLKNSTFSNQNNCKFNIKEASQVNSLTKSCYKDTASLPDAVNTMSSSLQRHLYNLEMNLVELVDDIHQNVISVSKAVIQAVEYFKDFSMIDKTLILHSPSIISTENCSSLRHITKVILHFLDNLLISEGFANSRSVLLKRYIQFLEILKIQINDYSMSMTKTLPYVKNFCIDLKYKLPNIDKIEKIIQQLLESDDSFISDQEGSFIAPVRRGLCSYGSILSIVFGVPNLKQEHYEMIKVLYSLFPDIHLYLIRDSIQSCAAKVGSNLSELFPKLRTSNEEKNCFQFSPPYMVTDSLFQPPISMSISTTGDSKMTGTLGGYLFPQIDNTNPKFSRFAGSAFAITSAHVVLSENQDYPYVTVPSKVLQKTYSKTLAAEAMRYPKDSTERLAFQKEAIKVNNDIKWQEENIFGQVVWGERSIVNQKLSDFAIIKVNPKYNVSNCLSSDLKFVKDPTLKFQNAYVKKKCMKLDAGLNVFKIGASSSYTSGQINGTKLVYWADGKLQTSEFVVASPLPLFATAGDSGAWILTKSEDYLGLSVVGMLHSYDGSQQQFGLFTPIIDILERLHDVTGVQWDIDS